MAKFKAILCDPPWRFECWGDFRGSAGPRRRTERHYKTHGSEWIETLPLLPLCDDDCCLFLWSIWPLLPDALRVIEAWGFTYKTLAFDWVKVTSDGHPRMGLGYWTRANSEPCLLATRGKPKRMDKGVRQVMVSPRNEHSEKPEEVYTRIERLVEGPYLEMFHRPRNGLFPPRDGWTFIGDAVTGRDIADDLKRLADGIPLS